MFVTLPHELGPLIKLCAKGEYKFSGTVGVRVLDQGNGLFRAEATNGRVAGVFQGPILEGFYCLRPGEMQDEQTEVIIPSDAWAEVFRKAKKLQKPVRLLTTSKPPGAIVVACDMGSTTVQAVDGRFPPINHVMPHGPAAFSIPVNPQLLIDLLTVAAALSDEETKRVNLVYFHKPNGPSLLGVTGQNAEGLTFDGLCVPLEHGKSAKSNGKAEAGPEVKPEDLEPPDDHASPPPAAE